MKFGISQLLICHPDQAHLEQLFTFLGSQWQNHPDFHLVNTADQSAQIADVRQLQTAMVLKPYQGEHSVYVILNIDHASLPAQNALLKSLEEPPRHVQLILTADRLHKVLPTVQSRCLITTCPASSPNQSSTERDLSSEVVADLSQLQSGSLASIFSISEKYKERSAANQFLQQLVTHLHHKNQRQPTGELTHQLQQLITAQDLLEKNVNVRLVLEDVFIRMRRAK